MLNKSQLEKLIAERLPGVYNPVGMDEAIYAIEKADESVRSKLEEYLTTGKEPEMTIEGYSYSSLKKDHGMNPIAALLTLNFLIKQPEKAKESLRKGHDHVSMRIN